MHRKSHQRNLKLFAGIVSLAVVALFVSISSSLRGDILQSGGIKGQQTSGQKPDLSISRTASDSVSWDGTYAVNYVVTNNGSATKQAVSMEPYFTGAYDNVKRVFVPSPISYSGMRTGDGIAPNRVSCGTGGGYLRCVFFRGINAGETLSFTVFYVANKAPVQCDRVLPMAPTTIVPGMNLNPFTLQTSLRGDSNPVDNTSAPLSVRIDCASITGDLQAEVTGPETIEKNSVGEFTVTLRNVGAIKSSTVALQITTPSTGFEIASISGKEYGGMCGKSRFTQNIATCNNPSVQLAPGQSVSYSLKLRALSDNCAPNEVKAEIVKSLKTPTPKFAEIYDTNDGNNTMVTSVRCSQISSQTTDEPASPPASMPTTPVSPQKPWGNAGFF